LDETARRLAKISTNQKAELDECKRREAYHEATARSLDHMIRLRDDELAALRARVAELEANAARYVWLRDEATPNQWRFLADWFGNELDQFIDQKIKAAEDETAATVGEVPSAGTTHAAAAATERLGGAQSASLAEPEGEPRTADLSNTYREFWQRHAMPPLARPSCLVCGKPPEEWPPAIKHMSLPAIIVCTPCVEGARASARQGDGHG
jgi:hypothetical protein